MTFSYDQDADVLYLTFEKSTPGAYGYVENENGDILKLDRLDHRVVGCTITSFIKRSLVDKIVIPEVGSVNSNEKVDSLLSESRELA